MYNVHYQPYWIKEDELEHFGIKGMKWGIRRYQNPDGTLTEAGKKRAASKVNKIAKKLQKYSDEVDQIAMQETPAMQKANAAAIDAFNHLVSAKSKKEVDEATKYVQLAGTMQALARQNEKSDKLQMQGAVLRKGLDWYEKNETLIRSVPVDKIDPKYSEVLDNFTKLYMETKKNPEKYAR